MNALTLIETLADRGIELTLDRKTAGRVNAYPASKLTDNDRATIKTARAARATRTNRATTRLRACPRCAKTARAARAATTKRPRFCPSALPALGENSTSQEETDLEGFL